MSKRSRNGDVPRQSSTHWEFVMAGSIPSPMIYLSNMMTCEATGIFLGMSEAVPGVGGSAARR